MAPVDDEVQIAELLRAFALATDRAAPREMAALMCADEAEHFLDNVSDPDAEGADTDIAAVDVLSVRVFGDLALARFTRPYFREASTLVCRRESGRWTVCADAEDELSLEQLEDDARSMSADATPDEQRLHVLRGRPIGGLSTEETRMLLSHNQGLQHLLPRAAVSLQYEPLLTAESHPGDLLITVLGVQDAVWSRDPVSLTRVRLAIDRLRGMGDLSTYGAPHDVMWDRAAAFEADHSR